MQTYQYTPLDLGGPAFRLVRLLQGSYDDPIVRGEIFQAWTGTEDSGIPYEAISYTWGTREKNAQLHLDDCVLPITENLYDALRALRLEDEDRILWADAICIDQEGNNAEKGHQVRQMGDIYAHADKVLVWLGQGNEHTDELMKIMRRLHHEVIRLGGNWRHSNTGLLQGLVTTTPERTAALIELLDRSWFRRVWILQEIARATKVEMHCGLHSCPASVFTAIPPLLNASPGEHCQAVLDIMPGPSRRTSWWSQKRDLGTLLSKFKDSQATDPRDAVYALLGISSDAVDSQYLLPDYGYSHDQVLWRATAFILSPEDPEALSRFTHFTRRWSTSSFKDDLPMLRERALDMALAMANNDVFLGAAHNTRERDYAHWSGGAITEHEKLVALLLETPSLDLEVSEMSGETALSLAAAAGNTAIVKALLDRDCIKLCSPRVDMVCWTFKTRLGPLKGLLVERPTVNFNEHKRFTVTPYQALRSEGQPILWRAVAGGHESVVEALLEYQDIAVNGIGSDGDTPLVRAVVDGHEGIVKSLLRHPDIDVNRADSYRRTPLLRAVTGGHEQIVEALLGHRDIDVNQDDISKDTPLTRAVAYGHTSIVKSLLQNPDIDVNGSTYNGQTVLSRAAAKGQEEMVRLLLQQPSVDPNLRDSFNGISLKSISQKTPLLHAVAEGHSSIVSMLVQHRDIDANCTFMGATTPLMLAASKGHDDLVKALLLHPCIGVNDVDEGGNSPLALAALQGHRTTVELLLRHPATDVNITDVRGWSLLERVTFRALPDMAELLLNDPKISIDSVVKSIRSQHTSSGQRYPKREWRCRECCASIMSVGLTETATHLTGWPIGLGKTSPRSKQKASKHTMTLPPAMMTDSLLSIALTYFATLWTTVNSTTMKAR